MRRSYSGVVGIDPEVRFLAKVDKPNGEDGCWIWRGSKNNQGYGIFSPGQQMKMYAHRWSYEHFMGQRIPFGLHIDHLCRVRHCVNPHHLEPVTPRENVLRGVSPAAIAVRTGVCKRGHALPVELDYRGRRTCQTCKRLNRRAKTRASGNLQRCPRYVKEEIWDRCGGRCELCRRSMVTIKRMNVHHRKRRSQGGDWSLANLMGLHQLCHNVAAYSVHANPERSYELGHLVRSNGDPAATPVKLWLPASDERVPVVGLGPIDPEDIGGAA